MLTEVERVPALAPPALSEPIPLEHDVPHASFLQKERRAQPRLPTAYDHCRDVLDRRRRGGGGGRGAAVEAERATAPLELQGHDVVVAGLNPDGRTVMLRTCCKQTVTIAARKVGCGGCEQVVRDGAYTARVAADLQIAARRSNAGDRCAVVS